MVYFSKRAFSVRSSNMRFNVFLIFTFALIPGILSQGVADYLLCFFKGNFSKPCTVRKGGESLERLAELARLAPSDTQRIIKRDDFSNASAKDIFHLFPVLFNFVPNEKLTNISGSTAAMILSTHKNDVSLTQKLLPPLKTYEQRTQFLKWLLGAELGEDVQKQLSKEIITWPDIEGWNVIYLLSIGHPLFAYLPPEYLLTLNGDYAVKYLFYLKTLGDEEKIAKMWYKEPALVKRTWSKLSFQQQYPAALDIWNFNSLNKLSFIMLGMNLNELERLDMSIEENKKLVLKFNWSPAQFRELFDTITDGNSVTALDPKVLQENWSKFLPRQLYQLSPEVVLSLKRVIITYSTDVDSLSLPTGLQLFELFTAMEHNHTTLRPIEMEQDASYRLLFLKKPSYLQKFCYQLLSPKMLVNIDVERYTKLQAYYLTGCGANVNRSDLESILGWYTFLKTLPSSYFIEMEDTELSRQILSHIIQHLKDSSTPLLASILQLFRTQFAQSAYFTDMLKNENNEMFELLSPIEISDHSRDILKYLTHYGKDDFSKMTHNLPQHILTPLLHKEGHFLWEDCFKPLPRHLAIGGLTCDIIHSVPPTDILPILSLYNRQRALNNKEFPKDLQYCVQKAVISYLELKTALYENDNNHRSIITYMDLSDIKSIGGYVLSSFPVHILSRSEHMKEIIQEIGALSLNELMLAMPRQYFQNLTLFYISHLKTNISIGLNDLLLLGNLTHFIQPQYLVNVEPAALQFVLESEYIDTRICADLITRKTWEKLIISSFGEPETWKADTILVLGDLLITVPISSIKLSNVSAWLSVADLLKTQYTDTISWFPRPVPFYKACMSMLGADESALYFSAISDLISYYLISVQNQLRTIMPAEDILSPNHLSVVTLNLTSDLFKPDTTDKIETVTNPVVLMYNNDEPGNSDRNNSNSDKDSPHQETRKITSFISYLLNPDSTTDFEHHEDIQNNGTSHWNEESQNLFHTNEDLEKASTVSFVPSRSTEMNLVEPFASQQSLTDSTSKTDTVSDCTGTSTVSDCIPTDLEMKSETVVVAISATPLPTEAKPSSTLPNVIATLSEQPPTGHNSSSLGWKLWFPIFSTKGHYAENEGGITGYSSSEPSAVNYSNVEGTRNDNKIGIAVYKNISITEMAQSSPKVPVEGRSAEEIPRAEHFVRFIENDLDKISTVSNLEHEETNNEGVYNTKVLNDLDVEAGALGYTMRYAEYKNAESAENMLVNFGTPISDRRLSMNLFGNITDSTKFDAGDFLTTTLNTQYKREDSTENSPKNSSALNILPKGRASDFDSVIPQIQKLNRTYSSDEIIKLLRLLNFTSINKNNNKKRRCRKKNKTRTKRFIGSVFDSEIKITCDALKTLGSPSSLAISKINVEELSTIEAFDCLELFGSMDLSAETKEIIWNKVKEEVRKKKLYHVLGRLISALKIEELSYMNFSIHADWTLETMYLIAEHVNYEQMHKEIVKKFLEDNKEHISHKPIPSPAVLSLGHMICYLPHSLLTSIFATNQDFAVLWTVFHRIRGCPVECFSSLGEIAVAAFGMPEKWSSAVFRTLGPLLTGMKENDWSILLQSNTNFTIYLTPSVVRCIPKYALKMFRESHLLKLPPSSALTLLEYQKNSLSKSQKKILNKITYLNVNESLFEEVNISVSSATIIWSPIFLICVLVFMPLAL